MVSRRSGYLLTHNLNLPLRCRLRKAEGSLREALQEKELLERKLTRQRASREAETNALQARNPISRLERCCRMLIDGDWHVLS